MSTENNSQPDIRDRIRAELAADKTLSQSTLARQAGLSASAISRWLKGEYEGDNLAVETKLQNWMDSRAAQQAADSALPAAPDWVDTPTARAIEGALRYAQLAGDMAVVYGSAGVGKTRTIRQYQRRAPNVWHATMTPASAGTVPALEEIAHAIGLRDISGGAARLHRLICDRLRETAGLLVIDEAQHLSVAALDQVRSIHDKSEIGVALVGNESVYARMTGGNRAAYLDRLYSRIGKKLRLRGATQGDIDALVDAWGIGDTPCRREMHQIASKPGALRVLTKVLRLASLYAQARVEALCCDDVRAAWRELGGEA